MSSRIVFSMIAAFTTLTFSLGISAQALYVTPDGDVGIGTDSPWNTAMEVRRSNGKAKILVTENGPPAERYLFHLKNPGKTHFKIEDTQTGAMWVFTNADTSFYVSKLGTGQAEFRIWDNGDADLAGTLYENSDVNSKQNIEPVDGKHILEKLNNLEVSEWSYKDAPGDRHIGPMAQDFHSTFGLGNTDKSIASLDTSGVALAAIKALIEENTSLKERMSLLESQQVEMQAVMLKVLENQRDQSILTSTVMN